VIYIADKYGWVVWVKGERLYSHFTWPEAREAMSAGNCQGSSVVKDGIRYFGPFHRVDTDKPQEVEE
jgi:hypothetical protein